MKHFAVESGDIRIPDHWTDDPVRLLRIARQGRPIAGFNQSARRTYVYPVLTPSGISVTQFSQLHLIQSLGGPTLKELSTASELERSTLGRNIRVLEKLGLVDMRVGGDARTRTIHLTRKGSNAFKRAIPLWHSVQSQLTNRLGLPGRTSFAGGG